MIEVIRNDSVLHGYGDSNDSKQVRGRDIYFIHIANCTCKNRPLIRMTEKCLEFDDGALTDILYQAVVILKEGRLGEFVVSKSDPQLKKYN
ncbi:MAG: hypothetical protein KAG61_08495 [Bacteriovoracaceae bacterium]|nr:hypothetical protein [Bacteriovoracaceae bacterium]